MKKFLLTLLLFQARGCCQDPAGAGAAAQSKPDPVFKVGDGVSSPALLYKVEPEYTEEARQAGIEGMVVLYVEINPEGQAVNPKVVRSLGHGLDEKALQAVARWKFRPSAKDGKPVTVAATIEVNFRLFAKPATEPPTQANEVAAIKRSADAGRRLGIGVTPGGRMIVRGAPVRLMIRVAYSVQDFQISGGPSWMNTDWYDIDGKASEKVNDQQIRPYLQKLLEDRFQLVVHRETKEVPAYDLLLADGGPKIVPSTEASCVTRDPQKPPEPGAPRPHFCGSTGVRSNLVEAYAVPMDQFVAALSSILGRTVTDKTGITYKVDVHLEFTPDPINSGLTSTPGEPVSPLTDLSHPSILTAIQEQLGLKLESTKALADILVVDRLERPSEN